MCVCVYVCVVGGWEGKREVQFAISIIPENSTQQWTFDFTNGPTAFLWPNSVQK